MLVLVRSWGTCFYGNHRLLYNVHPTDTPQFPTKFNFGLEPFLRSTVTHCSFPIYLLAPRDRIASGLIVPLGAFMRPTAIFTSSFLLPLTWNKQHESVITCLPSLVSGRAAQYGLALTHIRIASAMLNQTHVALHYPWQTPRIATI